MRVMVVGGDGFCGWPTALYLSDSGHDVHIIDNRARRRIDEQLGTSSLTPIASLSERVQAWELFQPNKEFSSTAIDVAKQPGQLDWVMASFKPHAIVHLGEQRAAPYSMKGEAERKYTLENNLLGTHNIINAIIRHAPGAHLVHLGTMGVYGYAGGDRLPEGYVHATIDGRTRAIVYPPDPGSIYHMTKVLDAQLFQTYARFYELRVTDLHQGIIWGTETEQTRKSETLINRFDYDGDYGTVLNRFLMQAACGEPLTVYGTGGQTRAFIHIRDSVRCIAEAVETGGPRPGDRPRIINQVTEVHNVARLAEIVGNTFNVGVRYVENPRLEAAENELEVDHKIVDNWLGETAHTLAGALAVEITEIVEKYKDRVKRDKIMPTSLWPNSELYKKVHAK